MRTFAYPFAAYNGGPLATKTYRRGGLALLTAQAIVKWATYSVGGVLLGSDIPNFSVITDISSAANLMPVQWQILSVYVDNEGVNFPVYVRFPDSQYTISCPANASGWFPAYTGARSCSITAIGITNQDIAALAQTAVYFTDDIKVPYLDPEQQTAVEYGLQSPLIQFGSGGSGVSSVAILSGGSGYTSNVVTLSGAGGSGAALTCSRDAYGRFVSAVVSNSGSGYLSAPSITFPAQSSPNAWASGTFYPNSTVIRYGTFLYRVISAGLVSYIPPPSDPANWENPNLPVNATASFSLVMTPASGGTSLTQQSNFGARALGDQAKNYIDDIVGGGILRDNLWGTPYASGSIILTSIFVEQLTTMVSATFWQIEDSAQNQFLGFRSSVFGGILYKAENCNLRLPATAQWRIRVTASNAVTVSHGFTYTYNPNY